MEDGSIEEVSGRLKLWCLQQGGGLARVEWDSAYARQEVINRLKGPLEEAGISLVEISLPPGQASNETVARLIEKLRSSSGPVVSITDIEWAFPEGGSRLDTLLALSFKREILAALPVRQIWWIPSHLTGQLILGVPDLDSWFQLRLHLREVPLQPTAKEQTDGKIVSVAEAHSLARRFWERLETARAQGFSEERISAELAEPAVEALLSAGLELEAEKILGSMADVPALLERHLGELRAARGMEDPEALTLASRLARILRDQGNLARARQLQEEVLEAMSRLPGESHAATLTAMNNLALTFNAQGDHASARRLLERAHRTIRNLWGDEHPATLTSMNNLAATIGSQGDHAGARQIEERVLETRAKSLGEEHPDTLRSMNNLAPTLLAQGDLMGARRIQERLIAAMSRVLGEEHPETLWAVNNLAATLLAQGDLAEARRLEERVLEVSSRVLGEEHPSTLRSMGNLGEIVGAQGDREASLRLLRKCLMGLRQVLGEEHPDTIAAADALKRFESRKLTA